MPDVTLTVNSGSSSLKFALYPAGGDAPASADSSMAVRRPLLEGQVTGIGTRPVLTASEGGEALTTEAPLDDIPVDANHDWLIARLLERLYRKYDTYTPVAVAHRIVHGGREFDGPVIIDSAIRRALGDLVPLAPAHQPANLEAVDAIWEVSPDLLQVACFDTSFHRSQPRLAQLFGLPRHLSEDGILRYGFHGLSYEHIAAVLPDHLGAAADGRVIVAHLGNGASLCAMHERRSVATSMGFTALDGLVMGQRCGSLDPGVVLHLLEQHDMTPARVHQVLYNESGLLGVSGISSDMRDLETREEAAAAEAIELFCYRAIGEIGRLTAALGGLDALVFTAGIGENSPTIRQRITDGCHWLGAVAVSSANERGATVFSDRNSRVALLTVPTDEAGVMARAVDALLRA